MGKVRRLVEQYHWTSRSNWKSILQQGGTLCAQALFGFPLSSNERKVVKDHVDLSSVMACCLLQAINAVLWPKWSRTRCRTKSEEEPRIQRRVHQFKESQSTGQRSQYRILTRVWLYSDNADIKLYTEHHKSSGWYIHCPPLMNNNWIKRLSTPPIPHEHCRYVNL